MEQKAVKLEIAKAKQNFLKTYVKWKCIISVQLCIAWSILDFLASTAQSNRSRSEVV